MARSTKNKTYFPLSRPAGGKSQRPRKLWQSVKYNRQPEKVTVMAVLLRGLYLELEITWAPLTDGGVATGRQI